MADETELKRVLFTCFAQHEVLAFYGLRVVNGCESI